MKKYRIYLPGKGYYIGEFEKKEHAASMALALDRNTFTTQKAYERARHAKALHQVIEVEDENGKETSC